MFLRKLWTAKLGEWLFGTGVAIACIAPIGANASTLGGKLHCSGSEMMLCLDNTTGLPCTNASGDGTDPTMYEACGTQIGAGDGGWPTIPRWRCATGCGIAAFQGSQCSVNVLDCYY
jgi:hypothetical protein